LNFRRFLCKARKFYAARRKQAPKFGGWRSVNTPQEEPLMFYSLTGTIAAAEESMLAVNCGGVAFACATTANTLREAGGTGQTVTLYTHLNVREDAMELFGFATRAELTCFRQLIAVTGVGPKAALAVLSVFQPEQLAFLVASGDAKSITRAQGVGPKLAQRMVLELKDKLHAFQAENSFSSTGRASAFSGNAGALDSVAAEALEALISLGYSQAESSFILRGMEEGLTTQELLRRALKQLAGEGRS
jgi:Holliday junction DNA helicase RuvA